MFLLHIHSEGVGGSLFGEVFLHGITDTLKIIPFLFLTYLLMEFIEHKAEGKLEKFISRRGRFGPLAGGALGVIPQCSFSSVASNLFAGRVISFGTLIAVFLSTSDEMLPILISGGFSPRGAIGILIYKALVAILVGFTVDLIIRLLKKEKPIIDIDTICENDGCHCEGGIFKSALHHTLSITLFILVVSFAINALLFYIGEDRISEIFRGLPVVSHIIAAVFGLIPNCAASVALTELFSDGIISLGTMLSGLFSGAGVGVLILFRFNRRWKENLLTVIILVLTGLLFGLLADLPAVCSIITG